MYILEHYYSTLTDAQLSETCPENFEFLYFEIVRMDNGITRSNKILMIFVLGMKPPLFYRFFHEDFKSARRIALACLLPGGNKC